MPRLCPHFPSSPHSIRSLRVTFKIYYEGFLSLGNTGKWRQWDISFQHAVDSKVMEDGVDLSRLRCLTITVDTTVDEESLAKRTMARSSRRGHTSSSSGQRSSPFKTVPDLLAAIILPGLENACQLTSLTLNADPGTSITREAMFDSITRIIHLKSIWPTLTYLDISCTVTRTINQLTTVIMDAGRLLLSGRGTGDHCIDALGPL